MFFRHYWSNKTEFEGYFGLDSTPKKSKKNRKKKFKKNFSKKKNFKIFF